MIGEYVVGFSCRCTCVFQVFIESIAWHTRASQSQCHRLLKHQVELIILPLRLLQSALHAFYLSHGLDRSDRTSGATTKEGSHGATPRYQPIYYIFGSMKPSSFWGTKKILETPKSTPSRQHEIRTSPLCLDVTGNPRRLQRLLFWPFAKGLLRLETVESPTRKSLKCNVTPMKIQKSERLLGEIRLKKWLLLVQTCPCGDAHILIQIYSSVIIGFSKDDSTLIQLSRGQI